MSPMPYVAELRERGIISCGPFGAWNPALVDPDLLFADGVEAVEEAMDSAQPTTTAPWLLPAAEGASRQVFRR